MPVLWDPKGKSELPLGAITENAHYAVVPRTVTCGPYECTFSILDEVPQMWAPEEVTSPPHHIPIIPIAPEVPLPSKIRRAWWDAQPKSFKWYVPNTTDLALPPSTPIERLAVWCLVEYDRTKDAMWLVLYRVATEWPEQIAVEEEVKWWLAR